MPQEPGLREKKTARTKIALMNAFIERLNKISFEQISIREVCESVEVSEGTFYNYFPQKTDVIRLFMQLMTIKMVNRACVSANPEIFLDRIDKYFEVCADELDKPNIMYAIVSIALSYNIDPRQVDISDLELAYVLEDGNLQRQITSTVTNLDSFFIDTLESARVNGELPKGSDLRTLKVALKAMLMGTPIALKHENFEQLRTLYQYQLKMLWDASGRRK